MYKKPKEDMNIINKSCPKLIGEVLKILFAGSKYIIKNCIMKTDKAAKTKYLLERNLSPTGFSISTHENDWNNSKNTMIEKTIVWESIKSFVVNQK